ncbi:hypothetical protein BGX38DRAFT_1141635 [Terfezia claveryi]|nr:hypothetical protein BGX38DRAFT_1141635 [Terfezia claveryi]
MRRKLPESTSQTLCDSITQSLDRIEALIKGGFNALDGAKPTAEGSECHCPPCLSGMTHTELFQKSYGEEELFQEELSRDSQPDATDPKMQKRLHKSGFTVKHLMSILPPTWVPIMFPFRSALFRDINHEPLAYHPTHSDGEGSGVSCLLRIKPRKEENEFSLPETFNADDDTSRKWHYVYDCGETQRLYFLGEDLMEAIAAVQVLQLGKVGGRIWKAVGGHADWVEVYCRGANAILERVRFWEENVVGRGFLGWQEGYSCGWQDATGEEGDDSGENSEDVNKEQIAQTSAEAKPGQTMESTKRTSFSSAQEPATSRCITANAPYVRPEWQKHAYNPPDFSSSSYHNFYSQFSHQYVPQYSPLPTHPDPYPNGPRGPTNFDQCCGTAYSSKGNQLYRYAEPQYDIGFAAAKCCTWGAGFEHGFEQGRQYEIDNERADRFDEGYGLGYEQGQGEGYETGKKDGYQEGYKEGKEDGKKSRFEWFPIENLKFSNPWITAKPTQPTLKNGVIMCMHGGDWRICKECASFIPDKSQMPMKTASVYKSADSKSSGLEGLGNLFDFNNNLPIGTKRCDPKSPQSRGLGDHESITYTRHLGFFDGSGAPSL